MTAGSTPDRSANARAIAANAKAITSRDNPLLVRLRKLATDPTAYRKRLND